MKNLSDQQQFFLNQLAYVNLTEGHIDETINGIYKSLLAESQHDKSILSSMDFYIIESLVKSNLGSVSVVAVMDQNPNISESKGGSGFFGVAFEFEGNTGFTFRGTEHMADLPQDFVTYGSRLVSGTLTNEERSGFYSKHIDMFDNTESTLRGKSRQTSDALLFYESVPKNGIMCTLVKTRNSIS